MTPQFLRAEAARFRGMAEVTELEASKQRLLAMALDYESKAETADGPAEPQPADAIKPKVRKTVKLSSNAV